MTTGQPTQLYIHQNFRSNNGHCPPLKIQPPSAVRHHLLPVNQPNGTCEWKWFIAAGHNCIRQPQKHVAAVHTDCFSSQRHHSSDIYSIKHSKFMYQPQKWRNGFTVTRLVAGWFWCNRYAPTAWKFTTAFWLPHVFGGVYDEHSEAPQTHTSHT